LPSQTATVVSWVGPEHVEVLQGVVSAGHIVQAPAPSHKPVVPQLV
jgi:hypothetical protein